MTAKNGKNRRAPARNGFGTANNGKSRHSRRNLTIQRRNKRQTAAEKMIEDQRTIETMKAQRRLMEMDTGGMERTPGKDEVRQVLLGVALLGTLLTLVVYLVGALGWH